MDRSMFDDIEPVGWAIWVLAILGLILGVYELVRFVFWVLEHVRLVG